MNNYETHVGWLKSTPTEMTRQEYEFDKLVTIARQTLFATIHQVTGIDIVQRSTFEDIIQPPEGRFFWWQLDASAVPAIGMPALRQAIGNTYKEIFGPYAIVCNESGMAPERINEYATALQVVPPEWTRTDKLWVPEAYRPAA